MNTRIILAALLGTVISGCWELEYVEVVDVPALETYDTCYSDLDCASGLCEEIAVPADEYGDYVNAICTESCFDDLDCPDSAFNWLPGACVPHDLLGGLDARGICVERCENDADCAEYAGFACTVFYGERLCLPS